MIRIHNSDTNEVIDREMNATEYKQYQERQLEIESQEAEVAAKAQAKAALLERLGITEDEAKLLLA